MNLEEKIFTKLFMNKVAVIEKREISDNVFHLKLEGSIQFHKILPGQHLRILLFPNQKGRLRDRVRTYSIWKYQQEKNIGTVDIAVCAHTHGPGSQWAKQIDINSHVLISNPLGKFTLNNSKKKHVFIGDISALAHFYNFLQHLVSEHSLQGVIYGDDKNKLFSDFDGSRPFIFYQSSSKLNMLLLDYCRNLAIDKDTMIYIGGEGEICVLLHKFLVKERKVSRRQLKVKPFWMINKTGLE